MANTKKNVRKNTKEVEVVNTTETQDIEKSEPIVSDTKGDPIVPEKKVFDQSDGIMCRSVISGKLYVEGIKTGMLYSFMDYGDETEIEYRDLVAAVRSKDKAVFEPRFIIEDADFIAEYPMLDKYYSDKFTTKDIKSILKMDDEDMKDAIEKLPNGARESLKVIAAEEVSAGILDSKKKIKTLNEIFGIDLDLIGEFVD